MGTSLQTLRPQRRQPTTPEDTLLCGATATRFREETEDALHRATRQLQQANSPTTGPSPTDLAPRIEAVDLETPLGSSAEVFSELEELYLRDAAYFHHPKYAAHLNCPVLIPSVAAEAFVSSLNTSMDTFDQSAGATLIEQRLVQWSAGLIGFAVSRADGIFTSGGTQSNVQAMLIARNRAVARLDGPLPHRLSQLRIYTSADAHFSIANAAMLLGLGQDAVHSIPTDARHRMDSVSLREQLERDVAAGLVPMAISATAGTTDFGAIDPLSDLSALARRFGAWLHIDAAYGCGLLVSPRHRQRLAGIEQADSVTLDFHKSFFQPIGSSALVLREGTDFDSIRHYADYLNPRAAAAQTPNQVDKSLQTTRRFDALKLWVGLRTIGASAIGTMFDRVIELAGEAQELIGLRAELRLEAPVQLSTVVFGFNHPTEPLPQHHANTLNDAIRQRLYERGQAMVAATTVQGRRLLKLTLLNPNTTVRDLEEILDLICQAGYELLAENFAKGRP
ncbi:pyridoxal phosphate-dependent decarboxylase family protein [Glutamicibacter creatinolyticus]|uniref:pyridoxal phosphate-dependent decarboxylase family protein n=1 Tax=Glutamicibacter TaxID=1742989 RepID=UPI0037BEB476